ncbi:MAG: C25 family cysteine peptidase, partial [candidate division Zixibacteria bacterium]
MKKATILSVAVFCLIAGLANAGQTIRLSDNQSGATLLSQDQSGISIRIDVGAIEFQQLTTDHGDFIALGVGGFSRSQKVGEPNLPVANRLLDIPFGCELDAVVLDYEIEEISLSDYGLTAPIIPVQPSLSKSQNPDDVPFEFKRDLYSQGNYYSLPLTAASEVGVMRAVRIGMISIAPIEYNPVTNTLRVYKNITVRVEYLHPDWAKTEDMKLRYYSPYFETVYSRLFNYEPMSSVLLDDLVQYPVKYVIISDRMFEDQLQPFIEWKIKKGFDVIEAYTDEIGNSNDIKAYLNGLYDAGEPGDPAPSFVLLVGDDQQIEAFQFSGHISDLSFCEYTGDHIPEIYYGRFSAQNPDLLQPQIDKTLEYEQYLMAEPDFLDDVTLIAGVDPTFAPTHGNGQINYGTEYYFNEEHNLFANVWLYPRSDDPGASGEIIQTVNQGVSLINYTAHGSHDGWADPLLGVSQINGLTNANKYPLAIGNCCLTNTFGDDYGSPCAGEVWLQAENKGAVGYIGASNNTYWDEDYWWGVGYTSLPINGNAPPYEETGIGAYDGLFHDHGERIEYYYITNSAVAFSGNMAVEESGSSLSNYYWEVYHLMGDPSVMTYVGLPAENTVDHPGAIVLGESSITVQADPYSYVGLSMNGVLHGSVFIDESGSATFDFSPFEVPGGADFVVSAQNKQPYITTIPVIAPSGPYVVFDSCMVNDEAGNDDGLIDFGEDILLGMRLMNVGPDLAEDVSAVLISDDPYITITDSIEEFGDIEGEFGTVTIADAYGFEVDTGIPDGHSIDFLLMISSSQDSWESEFSLTAHAPEIEFVDVVIDDQSGNGNGIFEAGETVDVVLTLKNVGTSMAGSVAGLISSSDEYVTIDDASGFFGDIAPSENGDNSGDIYVVTAHSDLPPGHAVVFELAVTADGGIEQDLMFVLKAIESFEYNDGGWAGDGLWQWGEPSSGPGSAYDGAKVWATNLAGQYENNVDDYLITGFYTVESNNAAISFYQWYNFESGWDGGNVSITTDAGNSWELITPTSGYPDPDVTGLDGLPGFSGETGGWEEVTFELGAFDGMAIQLGLRIGTDGSITRDGWYLDAVTVTGARGWRGDPDIAVSPVSYHIELEEGESTTQTLDISNEGAGILAYSIKPVTVGLRLDDDDREETPVPIRQDPNWGKYIEHHRDGEMFTVTYTGPKLESSDDESNPPVITDVGGPDNFGYMWIDSDEPDGPEFNWVDITGIGEPLTFSDDQNQGPFGFGFEMPFYDGYFNSLRICSNGWISFTSSATAYSNDPIPGSDDPNSLLAPFWDDLNPSDGGMIYFYTNNVDSAVVAWVGVPRYIDGGSMTFEAILTADGDITYQYASMQGTLNSCTVGIENDDGNDGLEVVYDSGYIADELAVRFLLPVFWLGVDPMSGFNMPDESSEFTVTFDAAELTTGIYTGYLQINSNDPVDPTVAVQCTLVVGEVVGIDGGVSGIPTAFNLDQNYPNPFNPTTTIGFSIPNDQRVTLKLYDLLGRTVATILDKEMQAGIHRVEYDGADLASGVYFYILETDDFV